MVLSFALCASFAFAQSNSQTATYNVVENQAKSAVSTEALQGGYNGSIFTKDDEIFHCSFSTAEQTANKWTVGLATASDRVNGQSIPVHSSSSYFGQWQRVSQVNRDSLSTAEANFLIQNYPVLFSPNSGATAFYSWINQVFNGANFSHETTWNGLMVMSMIDSYSGWGGNGESETYDSWIAFQPISTVGHPVIRARYFRFYRKFNYDRCYIDYSTDGTNWSGYELDVRGVDVSGNSQVYGWKVAPLPTSVGNQPNVYLRLRYFDDSGNKNGGYFMVVDDFYVMDAPDYDRRLVSNQYYEGFYQMMPQNFEVPVVWNAEFVNQGKNALTNVTGTVYQMPHNGSATALVSKTLSSVEPDPFVTRSIVIDPLAWYDSVPYITTYGSEYHGFYDPNFNTPTGTYAALPTANNGTYHFFTDITMNEISPVHVYGDTATFDTARYDVNYGTLDGTHPAGVWSRAHGVISKGSYYASGMVGESTFSTDPEETKWNTAGYGVYVTYVTGNQIPEGWKILGMEMTASTEANMNRAGARIRPELWYDFADDSTGAPYFRQIETGAATHLVTENEVISNNDLADLEYETYGSNSNPVIRMYFPNQPELASMTSYKVGYRLMEDHRFAVAVANNYYYTPASNGEDSVVYFYETPGMKSYGTVMTPTRQGNVMVHDPYDQGYHTFSSPVRYPMIRLIIGPGFYVPKTTVSFECEDPENGGFVDGAYASICDMEDSIVIGASASYTILPAEGYTIDKLWINGVEDTNYTIYQDEDEGIYATVTLENVTEPTVLRCKMKVREVGFDPIAKNVSMKLQPNPATSNVRIALKGVSGNVNMALIDMSGRVVSTTQFNAENGHTINVSNLAKGAYFVRITNDKFSKVEKLIVR